VTLTDKANYVAVAIAAQGNPSKKLLLYRDALIHAAALDRTTQGDDLELRRTNTLAVARRRLGKLSVEDRALVEACGGSI
jgi:hypothetical protein